MSNTTPTKQGLYKISDLARETGVSTGTIKFYIREGLLPSPTLKTGRNMAWYDRSFVDRIRAIKELQQKRFLPLDVIKAILDHDSEVISQREVDTLLSLEGTFYQEIHYVPGQVPITVPQAMERYEISEEQLRFCEALGVLTPVERNGVKYYDGDDILILENFRTMRDAGLGDELFPHQAILPVYVEAVEKLARQELKIFSRGVTGKIDAAEVAELAIASVKNVEQFIILIRRKLLLKVLQELRMKSETEPDAATGQS